MSGTTPGVPSRPIDFSLTKAHKDGHCVLFYGIDGKPAALLCSRIRDWGNDPFHPDAVATLYPMGPVDYPVDLLANGRAITGGGVETGEDFSMLLDLAIDAGLILPELPT